MFGYSNDLKRRVVQLKQYPSGCDGLPCRACKYCDTCVRGSKSYQVALDRVIEIIDEISPQYIRVTKQATAKQFNKGWEAGYDEAVSRFKEIVRQVELME